MFFILMLFWYVFVCSIGKFNEKSGKMKHDRNENIINLAEDNDERSVNKDRTFDNTKSHNKRDKMCKKEELKLAMKNKLSCRYSNESEEIEFTRSLGPKNSAVGGKMTVEKDVHDENGRKNQVDFSLRTKFGMNLNNKWEYTDKNGFNEEDTASKRDSQYKKNEFHPPDKQNKKNKSNKLDKKAKSGNLEYAVLTKNIYDKEEKIAKQESNNKPESRNSTRARRGEKVNLGTKNFDDGIKSGNSRGVEGKESNTDLLKILKTKDNSSRRENVKASASERDVKPNESFFKDKTSSSHRMPVKQRATNEFPSNEDLDISNSEYVIRSKNTLGKEGQSYNQESSQMKNATYSSWRKDDVENTMPEQTGLQKECLIQNGTPSIPRIVSKTAKQKPKHASLRREKLNNEIPAIAKNNLGRNETIFNQETRKKSKVASSKNENSGNSRNLQALFPYSEDERPFNHETAKEQRPFNSSKRDADEITSHKRSSNPKNKEEIICALKTSENQKSKNDFPKSERRNIVMIKKDSDLNPENRFVEKDRKSKLKSDVKPKTEARQSKEEISEIGSHDIHPKYFQGEIKTDKKASDSKISREQIIKKENMRDEDANLCSTVILDEEIAHTSSTNFKNQKYPGSFPSETPKINRKIFKDLLNMENDYLLPYSEQENSDSDSVEEVKIFQMVKSIIKDHKQKDAPRIKEPVFILLTNSNENIFLENGDIPLSEFFGPYVEFGDNQKTVNEESENNIFIGNMNETIEPINPEIAARIKSPLLREESMVYRENTNVRENTNIWENKQKKTRKNKKVVERDDDINKSTERESEYIEGDQENLEEEKSEWENKNIVEYEYTKKYVNADYNKGWKYEYEVYSEEEQECSFAKDDERGNKRKIEKKIEKKRSLEKEDKETQNPEQDDSYGYKQGESSGDEQEMGCMDEKETTSEYEQETTSEYEQETTSEYEQGTRFRDKKETAYEYEKVLVYGDEQETTSEYEQETTSEYEQETTSEYEQETSSECGQEVAFEYKQEAIYEEDQETSSEYEKKTTAEYEQETKCEDEQEITSDYEEDVTTKNKKCRVYGDKKVRNYGEKEETTYEDVQERACVIEQGLPYGEEENITENKNNGGDVCHNKNSQKTPSTSDVPNKLEYNSDVNNENGNLMINNKATQSETFKDKFFGYPECLIKFAQYYEKGKPIKKTKRKTCKNNVQKIITLTKIEYFVDVWKKKIIENENSKEYHECPQLIERTLIREEEKSYPMEGENREFLFGKFSENLRFIELGGNDE